MDTVHCSRCFQPLPAHALYCSRCGLSVPIHKPVVKPATRPGRKAPSIWLFILALWFAGKVFSVWQVDSHTMRVEPVRSVPRFRVPDDAVEQSRRAIESPNVETERMQESTRRGRGDVQRFNGRQDMIEAPRTALPMMAAPRSARRIVYVCDASSLMSGSFTAARQELRRSIDSLTRDQAFNLVFYHENTFRAVNENYLLLPTPANKAECFDFMDAAVVGGRPNPVAALQFAMRQAPEVIFFVTSGDFSAGVEEAVARACRAGNPRGQIRINPVVVRPRDHAAFAPVLERIARESAGDVIYLSNK